MAADPESKHCANCLTGSVIPGEPKGEMRQLAGLEVYFTTGGISDKVIVIAPDAFGLGLTNPKLTADALAQLSGFDVWVPDLLRGDHAPLDRISTVDKPLAGRPLLQKVTDVAKMLGTFMWHAGPTFFWRHRMAVLLPLAKDFCIALKKQEGVKRIAMSGYCLGGVVTTNLAGAEVDSKTGLSYIDVGITAHPGPLRVSDFSRIRVPFALVCAQEDFSFDSIKPAALKELERLAVPHAVYEHPGTTHGFAARPDITDDVVKEQYETALKETAEWCKAHL